MVTIHSKQSLDQAAMYIMSHENAFPYIYGIVCTNISICAVLTEVRPQGGSQEMVGITVILGITLDSTCFLRHTSDLLTFNRHYTIPNL